MALAEKGIPMGNIVDSSEKPTFSLFHRSDPKTRRLPNGEKIPIVKDINAYTSGLLEKEIQALEPKAIAQKRRPLVGGLKRAFTGIVSGTIKS